jgi:hypothetical protein
MTRDCQTKYTKTRNMIHYKRKLAEGQLYKYKASTESQEMARRSTRTPETRQAPNDKRCPDNAHKNQKHDSLGQLYKFKA